MKDYLDLFLNEYKSEGTKKEYGKTISKMLNSIGKDISNIKRIDLVEYKATFNDLSSATQAQRIVCIKSYFKFLYENEIIDKNPAETLSAPYIEHKPKDSLTTDEAISLMQFANKREKAILAVLLNTGIRVQELINMKLSDFENNPEEMIIKTKGNKFRKVVFNDDTIRFINDYLLIRKDGCENLFVGNQGAPMSPKNLNATWAKLAKKAGIKKHITSHTFRSTFITGIAKEHGLLFAQTCVGHANISTTRLYVRGIEDDALNIMRGLRVC